jgi:hypothetical protein
VSGKYISARKNEFWDEEYSGGDVGFEDPEGGGGEYGEGGEEPSEFYDFLAGDMYQVIDFPLQVGVELAHIAAIQYVRDKGGSAYVTFSTQIRSIEPRIS